MQTAILKILSFEISLLPLALPLPLHIVTSSWQGGWIHQMREPGQQPQNLPEAAGNGPAASPQLLPGQVMDGTPANSDTQGWTWPRAGETEIHYELMAAQEPG
jgi:hypothetical protein